MVILIKSLLLDSTLFLLSLIVVCVYLWYRQKFSYWKRRRVPGPTPIFPFGNIQDVIKRKAQFFQPYCDTYFKYKHLPYVGMFTFYRPVLCVNDLDLAKLIIIKDFNHFQSHGIFSGGAGDPLAGHLFNLHGTAWKNLRVKMSPTFTVGKLKSMYPLVEKVANEALQYIKDKNYVGDSVNYSEFAEKYTMEIIGSVGFGVECNGLKNPDSEFYLRGHDYFEPSSLYWTLIRALAFFAPNFFKKLKIKRINPVILDFFNSLVRETVEYRERYSYKRNDFLQTLIELKNGQLINEKGEIKYVHGFPFSMQDVAANTMLYMFAGYETSATTGQLAAYELAKNPLIQERARVEVNTVLTKYGGECTFEALSEMVYLNMILDETMRMYPPLRSMFRSCTKQYQLPDGLVIDKGTMVFIPVQAIQMDPDYFPYPERFDPERFAPQHKSKLHPCQWMPFGEGPRKCMGLGIPTMNPGPVFYMIRNQADCHGIEYIACFVYEWFYKFSQNKQCIRKITVSVTIGWVPNHLEYMPRNILTKVYNAEFKSIRQGYIQSMIVLVKLLPEFRFLLDPRTPTAPKLRPSSMTCAIDGGVWIKMQKLEK